MAKIITSILCFKFKVMNKSINGFDLKSFLDGILFFCFFMVLEFFSWTFVCFESRWIFEIIFREISW